MAWTKMIDDKMFSHMKDCGLLSDKNSPSANNIKPKTWMLSMTENGYWNINEQATSLSEYPRAEDYTMSQHNIDNKLDLYDPKPQENIPILEALAKGKVRYIQLMLKVGSDPNQKDAMGRTLLILLSYYRDQRTAATLAKYIIRFGGKIDFPDITGMNALHHACKRCKLELATILLGYRDDYDIFAKDGDGKMCFDYIPSREGEDLLKELKIIAVEYGLDPTEFHIKVPVRQSVKPRCEMQIPEDRLLEDEVWRKQSPEKYRSHKTDVTITTEMLLERTHFDNDTTMQREAKSKGKKHNCDVRSPCNCQSFSNEKLQSIQGVAKSKFNVEKICCPIIKRKDSPTKYVISSSNSGGQKQHHICKEHAQGNSMQKESSINIAGCLQGHKGAMSSKENLVRLYKIYEEQKSTLFRVGAKGLSVEEDFDKTSSTQGANTVLEEEVQLPATGKTSRSVSLCQASLPTIQKKRRPSIASPYLNKQLLKGKLSNVATNTMNFTKIRRFSSVSSSTANQLPIGQGDNVTFNTNKVLSFSASDISLIRKINAERKNSRVNDILIRKYNTQRERKVSFASIEAPTARKRNSQSMVSSFLPLNSFVETGEKIENIENQ